MTALQHHPAVRLPVGRVAPMVAGAAALAAALGVAAIALIRPTELATAIVAGGSVVLGVGAMYAALAAIRTRYLVSLTTIFMGLSMVRLIVSAAIGMAYMLTAQTAAGARPDKFVFGLVFLGVSLAVLAVETVLIRTIIQRLGESIAQSASTGGPAESPGPAHLTQTTQLTNQSANQSANEGAVHASAHGGRS